MKKIDRAYLKFNTLLDDEQKKLSDKIKKLEMSHKRMRSLLKMSLKLIDRAYGDVDPLQLHIDCMYLHKQLTCELNGLENYKGIK